MKQFKVGKSYLINKPGDNYITVTKITNHYLYFFSDYTGKMENYKKLIYKDNLFKLGENIYLKSDINKHLKYSCFAGEEK